MSKLLSILIAAVFALSTGSVFAAAHMKAAGEKIDTTAKDDMKTDVVKKTPEEKKAAKAAKKEKKAAKKKARKEARQEAAKSETAKSKVDAMNKEAEKK